MRVVVTGACGRIGTALCAAIAPGGELELVRADLEDRTPGSPWPFLTLDVTDREACRQAVAAADAMVHLAADPDPEADLRASVLPLNVLGTSNVFEAAVAADLARVVFASSGQVVMARPERRVLETAAPQPVNAYGAGKAFGEALCSVFASRSDTTFVAVRIGAFADSPTDVAPDHRRAWLSPRDAAHLLVRCLLAPLEQRYLVVNGTSANTDGRLSLDRTRELLGYTPRDDAAAWA